jgi:hypothetical protein
MAQFVLDTSQLNVDVLGPITFATASASLGSITATATVEIDNIVAANAPLGALLAQASTPQATVQTAGSLGVPNYIQPNITIPEIQIKQPKKIQGRAKIRLGAMKIQATSRIDFSVLNDDSELLLVI